MPPFFSPPLVHPGQRISNRVRPIMLHVPFYTITGVRRLARDCGVAHSTISRLIRGQSEPSYTVAEAVTRCLEKRLGVPLSMREVFTTDGTYPTACVCDLTPFCKGCFPPEAYDDDDVMRPEYRDLKPSDWCRYRPSEPLADDVSTSPLNN